jgi:hypothetical protein
MSKIRKADPLPPRKKGRNGDASGQRCRSVTVRTSFIFPAADLTAKSFAIQFGPLLVCRADVPLMHPLPQYINKGQLMARHLSTQVACVISCAAEIARLIFETLRIQLNGQGRPLINDVLPHLHRLCDQGRPQTL